jgi:predicted RND superfamily exporter protein
MLIFSITIGVGIDYAIHFISIFEKYRKKGHTQEESVIFAYKYSSRPIIANAFGISIGFLAMLLSPLQIHLYICVLMWISMMVSLFITLSILPTILLKLKK